MSCSFEWDDIKDTLNQKKHLVSFYEAQFAFSDKNRIIVFDKSHSQDEKRFFCIAKVKRGVLTVRFTHRNNKIRIFGGKVKKYMSKNTVKYKSIPKWDNIKKLEEVSDFLPKPEDLVYKSKLKKVTLALSEESIEFFKKKAKELNSSYQPMIRSLLDEYTRVMKQR